MKDIKCPSCGKTFRIDPSSFEEILQQIKDEEFNKLIKERLLLAEEDNKNQEIGQTKNSAKLVLFIFGIGPIIGITIFLYSKGFFNSPAM